MCVCVCVCVCMILLERVRVILQLFYSLFAKYVWQDIQ